MGAERKLFAGSNLAFGPPRSSASGVHRTISFGGSMDFLLHPSWAQRPGDKTFCSQIDQQVILAKGWIYPKLPCIWAGGGERGLAGGSGGGNSWGQA